MKRKYDYIALLEKQGSIALAPTESGAAESERCYVQMCKMLVADFLPPIAREDLAGLSKRRGRGWRPPGPRAVSAPRRR